MNPASIGSLTACSQTVTAARSSKQFLTRSDHLGEQTIGYSLPCIKPAISVSIDLYPCKVHSRLIADELVDLPAQFLDLSGMDLDLGGYPTDGTQG